MRTMRNRKPLVSVIVPAYNAAAYIEEALMSVIKQTYANLEILVIDDCSTDGTLEIVRRIAKLDSRIKVLKNKHNLGIGANRDKGLKNTRGEFICWQDADDISLPNRVALQVDFLNKHPKVGVVGGFMTFFSDKGDLTTRRYKQDDASLRRTIFKYNPVSQPACMMRRECFAKVGGYDPAYRLSEDLEMQFRIGEHYEFGNVQQVVLKYRQTQSSLTASNLRAMELATLSIRKKYAKSSAYHYSLFDVIYNSAQRVSMFMPTKLRMFLFKIIRGDI